MSKITITELDLTSVSAFPLTGTDIVYIPGFASGGTAKLYEPTLCKTIGEFEACFGNDSPVFIVSLPYPDAFPDICKPKGQSNAEMFAKDSADPSYIYAKELLARGLPVLYERVNSITDSKAESYDVTVLNMYNFLTTAFSSSRSCSLDISTADASLSFSDNGLAFMNDHERDGIYTYTWRTHNTITAWYDDNDIVLNFETYNIEYDTPSIEPEVGDNLRILIFSAEPKMLNKDVYLVKYLTTGGYPVFEYNGNIIVNAFATVAATRGDAIYLIDHTNNPERSLTNVHSVYRLITSRKYALSEELSKYCAMFTPYCTYNVAVKYTPEILQIQLPGSFAYLSCLANSIKSNPSWLAISGAKRGRPSRLNNPNIANILTNSIADSYQPDTGIAINPITNILPYGYCIWGNRTLVDNSIHGGTKASSFLNIRNLACDIKKQLYLACKSLMFEPNTDKLWLDFLALVTPTLDEMTTGYGIGGYKIIKENPSDKAVITATVRIYPIYSVEQFDITLYLQDGELSVEE